MDHNTLPEDRLDQTKSIYEVSAAEVFWKNFLAGLGRALGGLVVYLIFLGVAGYYAYVTVYPKLAPFVSQYMLMMQTLTPKSGTGSDTGQYDFVKQFQQYLPKGK